MHFDHLYQRMFTLQHGKARSLRRCRIWHSAHGHKRVHGATGTSFDPEGLPNVQELSTYVSNRLDGASPQEALIQAQMMGTALQGLDAGLAPAPAPGMAIAHLASCNSKGQTRCSKTSAAGPMSCLLSHAVMCCHILIECHMTGHMMTCHMWFIAASTWSASLTVQCDYLLLILTVD